MKTKEFGFISAINDYKDFTREHKGLIREISSNFERVFIINVSYLKLRNNNYQIKNEHLLPKTFIIKNFKKSIDFLNFFKDKDFTALQYLDKNPDFFKIFFLIKLAKIKNVMIMNLGNFGNSQFIDFNPRYIFAFRLYYKKGFYYFFRILTILNIFPKIEILFECNLKTIKALNNGLSRKFERIFPFFKISYFRKIIKVNSLFYDNFITHEKVINYNLKKKYLLFVHTPFNHLDKVYREGAVNKNIESIYYNKVKNFLNNLSNILNMKIVIGSHPSYKNDIFKEFIISKEQTIDIIPNSEVVVFTHSSLICNAVMYKKKIISIYSDTLGSWHNKLIEKYKNSLNLFSHNIDGNFNFTRKILINNMNNSIKYYDSFIKKQLVPDGSNLSNKKIIRTIIKKFFK
jgi:hypothetical protein